MNTIENNEALRCADEIGGLPVSDFCEALGDDAAAHIRRLVAENEALKKRNKQSMHYAMGKAAEIRALSAKLVGLAQAIEAHYDIGARHE